MGTKRCLCCSNLHFCNSHFSLLIHLCRYCSGPDNFPFYLLGAPDPCGSQPKPGRSPHCFPCLLLSDFTGTSLPLHKVLQEQLGIRNEYAACSLCPLRLQLAFQPCLSFHLLSNQPVPEASALTSPLACLHPLAHALLAQSQGSDPTQLPKVCSHLTSASPELASTCSAPTPSSLCFHPRHPLSDLSRQNASSWRACLHLILFSQPMNFSQASPLCRRGQGNAGAGGQEAGPRFSPGRPRASPGWERERRYGQRTLRGTQ